jgi:hypothetical protein
MAAMAKPTLSELTERAERDRQILLMLLEKGTGLETLSVLTGYPVKLIRKVTGWERAY